MHESKVTEELVFQVAKDQCVNIIAIHARVPWIVPRLHIVLLPPNDLTVMVPSMSVKLTFLYWVSVVDIIICSQRVLIIVANSLITISMLVRLQSTFHLLLQSAIKDSTCARFSSIKDSDTLISLGVLLYCTCQCIIALVTEAGTPMYWLNKIIIRFCPLPF